MTTRSALLVIDDDPANQTVIEALLEGEPYDLHFARSGREGLLQIEVLQPDIVVLDVMMPGMSGYEVCAEIRCRKSTASLPVLLVTALDDYASLVQGLRAGADHFITKPLRQEEFRAKLATIATLNRHRLLAEQRERFERLFALSPGATLLLSPDGAICMLNQQATELLALIGPVPRPGMKIGEWFIHEQEQRILTGLGEALAGLSLPSHSLALAVPRAGGGRIHLQVRMSTVTEAGQPLAMIIMSDTTELMEAQEKLEALNRELNERVRERTVELEDANLVLRSYASFVSHDLRTPLSLVKGYLSFVLEQSGTLEEGTRRHLDRCYRAVQDMSQLINDLLMLAQGGVNARPEAPVDLMPVFAKLVTFQEELEPRIKGRIQIDALPVLRISPTLIQRVFYNLLGNAVKYTADAADPHIHIGCNWQEGEPILFVKDNGAGFSTEESSEVFQEYSHRPHAARKDGIGIGLSLVRQLLQQHGCRIWAESRPEGGAVFFIALGRDRAAGPGDEVQANREVKLA